MKAIDTTVKDRYGDSITISTLDYIDDAVYIEAQESGFSTSLSFTLDGAREIRDTLNSVVGGVSDPNEAKLRLAADLGLRAKFDYEGENDDYPETRRVEPKRVFHGPRGLMVGGESYDEDGGSEGPRQFYLSRIDGKVAIR